MGNVPAHPHLDISAPPPVPAPNRGLSTSPPPTPSTAGLTPRFPGSFQQHQHHQTRPHQHRLHSTSTMPFNAPTSPAQSAISLAPSQSASQIPSNPSHRSQTPLPLPQTAQGQAMSPPARSQTQTPRSPSGARSPTRQRRSQHEIVMGLVKRIIPPLSPLLHKGQAGRIGVLGGSGDYSGAPFFAAMGAMRFGADLAHVICEPGAGAVIKTYSPDLIVHSVLDEKTDTPSLDNARRELLSVMERLHVLIIGPGLGRSSYMQSCAREALMLARNLDIGIVVDADGLWLLNSEPHLIKGLEGRIILTPNIMEFKRLAAAVNITEEEPDKHCANLARRLGHNVVILQKGADDTISHGAVLPPLISGSRSSSQDALVVRVPGGLKRVGGQGDILSGATGCLLAWGREWARGAYAHVGAQYASDEALIPHITLLAAYGASAFNRTVSRRGFELKGRSMVTHDLVELVGPVYEDMFGEKSDKHRL